MGRRARSPANQPSLTAELPLAEWDFSCPDWADRLKVGRSLVPDLPLNDQMVARSVGIFNRLRLPDVAGNPTMADAAGDWWRDVIAALFGSVDAQGVRHVRELLCLVPKKNSKTTNAGATGIVALLMDQTPRQSYNIFGPTQEIAERGFAQAVGMIEADREHVLQQRFHVRHHLKTIVDRVTQSTLKVQTFDEKVATGGIPKGVIIDELHILGKMESAARVLGQIRGGMLPRDDAFMLMITTQSDQPPAGVFKAELALARAIRDGKVKGPAARLLPVLYEFPEAVQTDPAKPWANPALWPMVLPNLNRSLRLASLEADWLAAQEKGEEEIRRWASQHLNIEVGLALHSNRWRGADYWEAAVDPELTSLEDLLARCEVAVAGIDGGGLDDLFGLAVVGRERGSNRWLMWAHGWVQADVLELRKDIAPRLRDFAAAGELTLCDEVDQDIREAVQIIVQVRDAGLLPDRDAIGLDPQGVGALVDALAEEGLTDPQVVAVGQGYRLFSAVSTSERKLKTKQMLHGGGGLLTWCVGNAKAEQRDNAVVITKSAAGKAKIDPLIAVLNAVKLMEKGPKVAPKSPYVDRGMLII